MLNICIICQTNLKSRGEVAQILKSGAHFVCTTCHQSIQSKSGIQLWLNAFERIEVSVVELNWWYLKDYYTKVLTELRSLLLNTMIQ